MGRHIHVGTAASAIRRSEARPSSSPFSSVNLSECTYQLHSWTQNLGPKTKRPNTCHLTPDTRSLYHARVSPNSHRGKFITFEGLDGTGKSTQIEKLAKALRARGISVAVTREPGGTPTGEKIRHVILDSATTGLAPMAEMALMFASRVQHIHEVIAPAMNSGKVVLCDRFTDSTEAYQGSGRKLGSKAVLDLHRILCDDLQPDLTILMDSDVATSVERARRR